MKPLVRDLTICGFVATLTSVGISLLFTWGWANFISFQQPVPFLVACRRLDTLALGIWLFVIVFVAGAMRAALSELKRWAKGK